MMYSLPKTEKGYCQASKSIKEVSLMETHIPKMRKGWEIFDDVFEQRTVNIWFTAR